ncbi:hypothetical protein [Teredinibacter purpureus]|uniref:hypothetical protein n=1 Tax=Teredinibacter purpureus TaxID=2731756 RepID=UPI0005F7E260|nr:hypothetical protein [Teredinibacter purpureus]
MKNLVMICTLFLSVLASAADKCDEQCLKAKAETDNNVTFPAYLSWKHCDDTRMDFMTSSMSSLDNYKTHHFNTRYKGGMRNIQNFVIQRKEWMVECDQYFQLTGKKRIFEDTKTTKEIFSAMDALTKELGDLIAGATYTNELGQDDSQSVINERFDYLLQRVDEHKTLMHLKGRYVNR